MNRHVAGHRRGQIRVTPDAEQLLYRMDLVEEAISSEFRRAVTEPLRRWNGIIGSALDEIGDGLPEPGSPRRTPCGPKLTVVRNTARTPGGAP